MTNTAWWLTIWLFLTLPPDPLACGQVVPDGSPSSPAASPVASWHSASEAERSTVTLMLESPDWPFRAFGLLRLEHYCGDEVQPLLAPLLSDPAWQVRCFALRQAHRLGMEVPTEILADETDGRVLRAALRYGAPVDSEKMIRGTARLLKMRSLEDMMLGLELAAAGDNDGLKNEAAKRAERLIRNMNDATAVRVSRRLAALVGVFPPPRTVGQWRQWLHGQGGSVKFADQAGTGPLGALVDHDVIAGMDSATFARLREYLDALRKRDLELAIVMDCTWSMVPMINEVRAGVEMLILYLSDISQTMRLAFVAYRDHDNPPVWEGYRLTSDVDSIRKFLFDLAITGGADYPEAVLDGLRACRELDFSRNADRQIVLIGDAPPHEEDLYQVAGLVEEARNVGITTHSVHVPMQYPAGYVQRLQPPAASQARVWLERYNQNTRTTFAEIARMGGGDSVQLTAAEDLVPAIVHCTIQEAWWPAFDEFYALYLELCR